MADRDLAKEHLPLAGTCHASLVLPFDESLPSTRRRVLLASLLAALPFDFSSERAAAINPSETQITLPNQIKWTAWTAGPRHSAEMATLFGGLDEPGPYVVLMKWYPAPSDANLVKLSGNFLIAATIECLGEAIALARKSGIDAHRYVEILTGTLFSAPVSD